MTFIGTVYKLTLHDDRTYIGSTRQKLMKRINNHQYKDSVIGLEVLETILNPTKIDLRKLEQYYINNNDCINYNKAFTTNAQKEYEKKRSINSDTCDMEKVIKKRINRKNYYAKKKNDPNWIESERQRNRLRMREKRLKNKHDSVAETERVCVELNNSA